MKSPFTRRAEAFADALEHASTTGAVPAAHAGVAPLVFLAERLVAVPQVPVGGAMNGFRAHLMTQASATLAPVTAPGVPSMPTPGVPASTVPSAGTTVPSAVTAAPHVLAGTAGQLVAGALAMAVAVTGAGVAAQRSVPGQPFYGLKRLVESIQRANAGSPVDQARQLSDEASARLDELQRMLADGSLSAAAQQRVADLLADLALALDHALDQLTGVGAVPAELVAQLTTAWNTLAELVPSLPAASQPDALAVLSEVNNRLGVIVDGASPVNGGVPHTPAPIVIPTIDVPTALPTALPTAVPTVAPTALPTTVPTPTVLPTAVPTVLPTSLPTTVPTTVPTPTALPSDLPSISPFIELPLVGPIFAPRIQIGSSR